MTMSNVAQWLEERSLGKYAALFEEHGIDRSTLPELTKEDFREMSIPIGPRRKLLRAISIRRGRRIGDDRAKG